MERVLQFAARLLFPPVREETTPPPPPVPDENDELASLKERIEAAQTRFEQSASDEETEAAIYELNALEARYRILLRHTRIAAK